jgi:RNA polymerase sigma-70 factor (ECF subfamily)
MGGAVEKSPGVVPRPEPRALEDLGPSGRRGDRHALQLLIGRYQNRVARFVLSQTGDPNTVEDLCQAVFVKMVVGLPRLRDTGRFESWLFQIARNVCRDHTRAALGWRRYFVSYTEAYDQVAEPETLPTENELEIGVARLSPQDRALLRLHIDEKRSYRDIARLSDTTVSAVKSRLYRLRRELRGLLIARDSE